MTQVQVHLECPIHDSFRVRQVAGMFDLTIEPIARETFRAEVPSLDEYWQIGAIVGPSGSGKTSIARAAFGDALYEPAPWPAGRAIIDCLGERPIKQITRTLTAVGFSSPRAWLKPHAVLSNGEKFRCELARAVLSAGTEGTEAQRHEGTKGKTTLEHFPSCLRASVPSCLASPSCLCFDEFTSVVDRTVARIGSAALSKAIRSGTIDTRFVAVTCHYDIIRWLQPDWVLDMSQGDRIGPRLGNGSIVVQASKPAIGVQQAWKPAPQWQMRSPWQGRPPIPLRIERCDRSLWPLFERHHYLSKTLHRGAACFVARFENRPAAFAAVLPFPHPLRPGWREHRLVCLPDFQGVGIGSALSEFVASLFVATGKPYFSTTSHPAMIAHRANSPLWKMHRRPRMVSRSGPNSRASCAMSETISRARNTAGFEFIGSANPRDARRLGIFKPPHKPGQSGRAVPERPRYPNTPNAAQPGSGSANSIAPGAARGQTRYSRTELFTLQTRN